MAEPKLGALPIGQAELIAAEHLLDTVEAHIETVSVRVAARLAAHRAGKPGPRLLKLVTVEESKYQNICRQMNAVRRTRESIATLRALIQAARE